MPAAKTADKKACAQTLYASMLNSIADFRESQLIPRSPLYEFCELQTVFYDSHASCRLSASLDQVQLRDVHLRCPDSPLAKHLRQRFHEMLRRNVKLGKRTLSEFRADKSTSTYYLHVLVSSDGQRLTLRARLLYDPVYLCVPAVEDGKDSGPRLRSASRTSGSSLADPKGFLLHSLLLEPKRLVKDSM